MGRKQVGRRSRADSILALFCLLAAAAFAAPILSAPERAILPDSIDYLRLAQTMAETGRFAFEADGPPEILRTPGYPAFLVLLGPWKTPWTLRGAILTQILLLALSGFLLRGLLRRLGSGPGPTRMGVALFLLNPLVLLVPLLMLSETLFVFLSLLATWFLVQGLEERGVGYAIGAGISAGGAVLVRPIGLAVMLAALLGLLWTTLRSRTNRDPRGQPTRRSKRRLVLSCVLAGLLLPAGWTLRNGAVSGYWGVSATPIRFLESSYGRAEGRDLAQAEVTDRMDSMKDRLHRIFRGIGSDPLGAVRTFVRGAGHILFGPGEWMLRNHLLGDRGARSGVEVAAFALRETRAGLSFERYPIRLPEEDRSDRSVPAWILLLWSVCSTLALYAWTAAGAIRGLHRNRRAGLVWLIPALLLLLLPAGPAGYARFRIPALPFLVLAGAAGWAARSAPPGSSKPPLEARGRS